MKRLATLAIIVGCSQGPIPSPDANPGDPGASWGSTKATSYVCQARYNCGGEITYTEIEFCPYDPGAIAAYRRYWALQCENTATCTDAYTCWVEDCYSTHVPCTP